MQADFELTYFLYLNELDYKDAMIECGVSSLINGIDSENIVLLAGSSSESDQTVAETFISAASEIGLHLPVKSESEEWSAQFSVRYLLSGMKLPSFDMNRQFKRNLNLLFFKLQRKSLSDTSISLFVNLLKKFVSDSSYISDYTDGWIPLIQNGSN